MRESRLVAVANTSPLQYLHQTGLLELLPRSCTSVCWWPPAVVAELVAGRALGFGLPDPTGHSWAEIVRPQSFAILPAVTDLGPGEREALALAVETSSSVLIIDDGLARRHADLLRLRFTGTVGVLLRAKREGLLPAITPVLDRLEALRFRLDVATRRAVLSKAGEES